MFAIAVIRHAKKVAGKNLSLTPRGTESALSLTIFNPLMSSQQAYGHALAQLYSKFIQIVMRIMMKMDDHKQAYWLPSVAACEYCLSRHWSRWTSFVLFHFPNLVSFIQRIHYKSRFKVDVNIFQALQICKLISLQNENLKKKS